MIKKISLLLCLLFWAVSSQAAIVRIEVTGNLTRVGVELLGLANIGDPFSASFTIDESTLDNNTSSDIGEYTGIQGTFSVGSINATALDVHAIIRNDHSNMDILEFEFLGGFSGDYLFGDQELSHVSVTIQDSSGTAYSDDSLLNLTNLQSDLYDDESMTSRFDPGSNNLQMGAPGDYLQFTSINITVALGIEIEISGGSVQECSQTDGAMVSATANITIDPSDSISGITWLLDGQNVGNDTDLIQLVTLGTHQIEVNITTVNGESASDVATITIEDTQPPDVTAQFINRLTGEPMNTLQLSTNLVEINSEASDVCDPSAAVIDAFYGNPTSDGNVFLAIGFQGKFVSPQNKLVLKVVAQDASGNRGFAYSVLNAP